MNLRRMMVVLALTACALPLVSWGQQVEGNRAHIAVRVPANATVTIDTLPTKQAGSERLYVTPALTPGQTFTYQLEATWTENGEKKQAVLQATVRAGQRTRLDFTAPGVGAPERLGGPKKEIPPPAPAKKAETPKKTDSREINKEPTVTPPVKKIETKKEPAKKSDLPEPKKSDLKKETKKVESSDVKKDLPAPKKSDAKKEAPKKVDPADVKKSDPKRDLNKDVPPPAKKTDSKKEPPADKKDPASSKKEDTQSSLSGKKRTFLFTYAGAVKELKPGQDVNVWLPVAASTPEQEASIVSQELPGKATVGKDKEYGNAMLHFHAKANEAGQVPFKVVYKVTRHEVKTDAVANVTVKPRESEELITRFLKPDAKVPTSGKPLNLIKGRTLPGDQFASAKILYDMVNGHMTYSKQGTGWGQGDAEWACDSKFGNCSDFHSLFIALARGNNIPSKFEMGFPLPAKHGSGPIPGYHCWAWFMPMGKGWVPVDISEANQHPELREYYFGNLTENRVVFSRGRDIVLDPPQKGSKLNFFVYPYAEVEGAAYPADKVARSFSFEDITR